MKRFYAALAILCLTASLFAACGAPAPSRSSPPPSPESSSQSASDSTQGEDAAAPSVQWAMEPNFTCDEMIPMDHPSFLTTGYSFYKKNGAYGVIDQTGTIVYSDQKQMTWCFNCGLADGAGDKYLADGTIEPYMHGHGGGGSDVYDTVTQKALQAGEYGMFFSISSANSSKSLVPIVKIIGDYTLDTGDNCDATVEPTDASRDTFCLIDRATAARVGDETYLATRGSWEITELTGKDKSVPQGYTACTETGKWFFYDKDGKKLSFGPYEDAKPFHSGFAAVKQDGLWGYIDEQGAPLTPVAFEDAASGYNGKAWAKQNGLWGVLQLTQGASGSGDTTASGQTIIITAEGGLRMRTSPDTSGDILEVIPTGTSVGVLAESNGWYQVEYNAKTGWVSAQHTAPA